MSMNQGSLTPLYRVSSTPLTTPVTHATLNGNSVFSTNIPSVDYYLNIRRIRWFAGNAVVATPTAVQSWQLFCILSESSTKTSVASTETQFLDMFMKEYNFDFSTSAGFAWRPESGVEAIVTHEFPGGVPTIATKLNMVTTLVENTGTAATNTWSPIAQVEFELLPLNNVIRDYLAKRIQIQQ